MEGAVVSTSQTKLPRHRNVSKVHIQSAAKPGLKPSGLLGQCSPVLLYLDSPTLRYYLVPSTGLGMKGKGPRPTSALPAEQPVAHWPSVGWAVESTCPGPGLSKAKCQKAPSPGKALLTAPQPQPCAESCMVFTPVGLSPAR